MGNIPEKGEANILSMQNNIADGLRSLEYMGNWYEEYQVWRDDSKNQFDALLTIENPFNLECVGNRNEFDLTKEGDVRDLDIIRMSLFLSEHLRKITLQVLDDVINEKMREKKKRNIEDYFVFLDQIINEPKLSGCNVTLKELAETQMVLSGSRMVDLYVSFFCLEEILRKSSIESLYLLYHYWRITKTKKALKTLVEALVDYVQSYYYEFDKDPDMHLYDSLEGLVIVKKLKVIEHWLELIAYHTNGIFEKYKDLNWLHPADELADDMIETNQISWFEMMQYKCKFEKDDKDTVIKKSVCNHGYKIWIKSADVMYIVCDVFQILSDFSEEELKKLNTTKKTMFEQYNHMEEIRDYYMSKVFSQRAYFKHARQYYNPKYMQMAEDDAEKYSKSIGDVIEYVDAIEGEDIEGLLQAKKKYLNSVSEFISEDHEKKMDILTGRVVEKIKANIQTSSVYDQLYNSVSKDFMEYATALLQHSQILSSLVSAEYLYRQYVVNRNPIKNFDYSCISVMYYMALEDFVNKLVYIPYSQNVLIKFEKIQAHNSKWIKNDSKKYVPSFRAFWDKKQNGFKKSCEIGVLGHLLEGIDQETDFKSYVAMMFPGIDINKMKQFGTKLKNVAPRRNDAAHGGRYLSYNDACMDKQEVYNSEAKISRGLILEFMEICFG